MKVAVFGAGTMGSGIAQVFAAKGHTALMYASSVASAQKHKDKLVASLAKRVAKGKMTQEAVDALRANVLVEEKSACAGADLIIECVKEDMATKKAVSYTHLLSLVGSEMCIRDSRDGSGLEPSRYRHAFLQPRAKHEAGGNHPGCQHHPGDLRLHL